MGEVRNFVDGVMSAAESRIAALNIYDGCYTNDARSIDRERADEFFAWWAASTWLATAIDENSGPFRIKKKTHSVEGLKLTCTPPVDWKKYYEKSRSKIRSTLLRDWIESRISKPDFRLTLKPRPSFCRPTSLANVSPLSSDVLDGLEESSVDSLDLGRLCADAVSTSATSRRSGVKYRIERLSLKKGESLGNPSSVLWFTDRSELPSDPSHLTSERLRDWLGLDHFAAESCLLLLEFSANGCSHARPTVLDGAGSKFRHTPIGARDADEEWGYTVDLQQVPALATSPSAFGSPSIVGLKEQVSLALTESDGCRLKMGWIFVAAGEPRCEDSVNFAARLRKDLKIDDPTLSQFVIDSVERGLVY